MKKNGFTLIELMIVIAIIALLAAVALPKFANTTQDAKAANVRANLSNLRTAISMQFAKTGNYPVVDATGIAATGAVGTTFDDYYSRTTLPVTPADSTNGVTAINTVIIAPAAAAALGGWRYTAATGEIHADLPVAAYGAGVTWTVE